MPPRPMSQQIGIGHPQQQSSSSYRDEPLRGSSSSSLSEFRPARASQRAPSDHSFGRAYQDSDGDSNNEWLHANQSQSSNNPFRQRVPSEPQTRKSGPPLPPRKASTKGPALPPRRATLPVSSSSSSLKSIESGKLQPTSNRPSSTIIQQSLAAVEVARTNQPRKDVVFEVIRRSNGETLPKVAGRSGEIISAVSKALTEAEDDRLPAPPQRRVSTRAAQVSYWQSDLLSGTPQQSYALIILNQPITRPDVFFRVWESSAIRLCADGGANRLFDFLGEDLRSKYLPTMIKGDLDSIRSDVREYYLSKGTDVNRDTDQYSTDLMKCIHEIESIERRTKYKFSLLLLGGLSGRVDQTVHTMSLLYKLRKKRNIFVLSEESLAWVLDEGTHDIAIDHHTMGQTCGILPVGVDQAFVQTSGLKWNLAYETSLADGVTSFEGLISTSNHLVPSEPIVRIWTSRPVIWTVEIRPLGKLHDDDKQHELGSVQTGGGRDEQEQIVIL